MKKTAKIISLLLAAALALSLCACGSGGDNSNNGGNGKADSTPTPEYVYASSFSKLNNGDGHTYLNPFLFTETGFYTVENEKVGEMEHDAPAEYEGQYDIYETRLYLNGYDGTRTKLENYAPVKLESHGQTFTSSLSQLCLMADGSLMSLETLYLSWSDAPEGVDEDSDEYWNYYQYEQHSYLRSLDATGAELSCAELSSSSNGDDSFYPYNMVVTDDGKVVVASDMLIRVFNTDGSVDFDIDLDNYPENLIKLRDGNVGVLAYGNDGYGIQLVDIASRSLGKTLKLKGWTQNMITGDGDYDIYYTNGLSFYGYNFDTETETKIFSWLDCDVNTNDLSNQYVLSDGRIVAVTNEWDGKYENCTSELITISKVPSSSLPQKTYITLGTQGLNWDTQELIVKFNRNSDQYRIQVNDYSEYNTEDDYSAGLTKLTTEIMAGNVPDILDLSGFSVSQLAGKGLIADLDSFFDADPDLNKSDFIPNVLAAFEVDGKLYSTVSNFNIQGVAGASSIVGDTPGWNYEQLQEALAKMPEGCQIFNYYTTSQDVLSSCLALDMGTLVDWTTGQCNFDSQGFIDMLKFASQFQNDFNWDSYEYSDDDDDYTRVAQGKQMLLNTYISDFNDLPMYDAIFGGSVTYIGYPTSSGTGNMLNFNNSGYAISARCENKDAAWQFIRTFFTEDFQKEQYGFPSNINAYNAKLKEAMTPEYMKDGNGNYVLDENGNKIEVSRSAMSWGSGDNYIEIYATTQEQADKLWELITTTTKVADYSSSIYDIVNEQTPAFFSGQKSAEEVARLIQNKANIYVNEQR